MPTDAQTYQIKVTLLGFKPAIWRRLLVSSSLTLKDLHHVLQIALGWTNSHLHQFISNDQTYGHNDGADDMDWLNENDYRLADLLPKPKASMIYEYDFGDGWEHKIVLEKILTDAQGNLAPFCIDGACACPPEDCGGPYGYENLLTILATPSHPEHKEMRNWAGGLLDPEHFDLTTTNRALSKLKLRSQSPPRKRTSNYVWVKDTPAD